jgi:hypothetical protein
MAGRPRTCHSSCPMPAGKRERDLTSLALNNCRGGPGRSALKAPLARALRGLLFLPRKAGATPRRDHPKQDDPASLVADSECVRPLLPPANPEHRHNPQKFSLFAKSDPAQTALIEGRCSGPKSPENRAIRHLCRCSGSNPRGERGLKHYLRGGAR